MEIYDGNGGEPRIFEFHHSKLVTGLAFAWERQIEWLITLLFQWRGLVHKVVEKANEDGAYNVRLAERRGGQE